MATAGIEAGRRRRRRSPAPASGSSPWIWPGSSPARSPAPTCGRPVTEVSEYAELDLDRARRRGYPEAMYCAGKTPEQVAGIAAAVRHRTDIVTLFTRAAPVHAEAVLAELPDAYHDPVGGLLAW